MCRGAPVTGRGCAQQTAPHCQRARPRPRQPSGRAGPNRLAAYARLAAKKEHQRRAKAASSARTTSLQRESGRRSSGCVRSGPSGKAQGCTLGSALVKPWDSTSVVSTASCMPPHRMEPLAMRHFTLPTLRSLTKVCLAAAALASRQMRAAARSSGPPRARKTQAQCRSTVSWLLMAAWFVKTPQTSGWSGWPGGCA